MAQGMAAPLPMLRTAGCEQNGTSPTGPTASRSPANVGPFLLVFLLPVTLLSGGTRKD